MFHIKTSEYFLLVNLNMNRVYIKCLVYINQTVKTLANMTCFPISIFMIVANTNLVVIE